MSHHYQFDAVMTCGGCSGAIDRVLKKLDGVDKYDVSLENQTVDVYVNGEQPDYNTVLTTIKKTGKTVKTGKADGKDMSIDI